MYWCFRLISGRRLFHKQKSWLGNEPRQNYSFVWIQKTMYRALWLVWYHLESECYYSKERSIFNKSSAEAICNRVKIPVVESPTISIKISKIWHKVQANYITSNIFKNFTMNFRIEFIICTDTQKKKMKLKNSAILATKLN